MSQFKETKLPCADCGSSDARAVYQSGVSICFSCGLIKAPGDEAKAKLPEDAIDFVFGETQAIRKRGLYLDTCRRYGYAVGNFNGKPVQIAPFYNERGQLVAQKLRTKNKDFPITGNSSKVPSMLWGLQLARRGGKMIVVTEGEIDAMSVSQAMGNTWPAVSLPNGSQSLGALKDSLEFLETYEKVVLCFDNDNPGRKATEAALELFSPGKAFVAELGEFKDANEMLQAGKSKELRQAIWEAKQFRPDGIINLDDIKDRIMAKPEMGFTYPWPGLNEKLYGFRRNELITWTAGTGVGKTALVSELVYDLVVNQELRVGVIYLEEGVERAARRLVGIAMDKPVHLEGTEYTSEEFEGAYARTIGTRRVFAYDHFGSLDGDHLVNRIRHMVRGEGVDVVILDHVSMVVSGNDLDVDERRMLDHIMTAMASLVQETGASIHVVSHLRRPSGSTSHEEGLQVSLSHLRGTQAIAQLSHAVIAAERNQQAETEEERNTTQLRVLKNRYAGVTGPADKLMYSQKTGRLVVIEAKGAVDFGEQTEDY
jgi:twinkle protein